jgi:hypothetical protein
MVFIQSLFLIYNLFKNVIFIQKLRFNLELIKKCGFHLDLSLNDSKV